MRPLLLHTFSTAVLRVDEERFLADAAIMDSMVQLQPKKGEKKGKPRAGKVDGRRKEEEEAAQELWGMLYADDAGIISRSPGGLDRAMTVVVTA